MHGSDRLRGRRRSLRAFLGWLAGGTACGVLLTASGAGAWADSSLRADVDATYSYTRFHEASTDSSTSSGGKSSGSSSDSDTDDDADADDDDDDDSSSAKTSSGNSPYLYANGGAMNGRVLYSFDDPGLNLQVGTTLKLSRIDGDSVHGWNGNANLFWRDDKGTFGVSTAYGEMNMMWDALHGTSYGLFGEWYFWPEATLRFRGGRVSAHNYGESYHGGYGGVGAEFYVTPKLGISADCNYITLGGVNISEASGSAEYLLSGYLHLPLSVSASYTYRRIEGTHADTIGIRLKYHFGGASSQVEADRTGPVRWTGLPPQM